MSFSESQSKLSLVPPLFRNSLWPKIPLPLLQSLYVFLSPSCMTATSDLYCYRSKNSLSFTTLSFPRSSSYFFHDVFSLFTAKNFSFAFFSQTMSRSFASIILSSDSASSSVFLTTVMYSPISSFSGVPQQSASLYSQSCPFFSFSRSSTYSIISFVIFYRWSLSVFCKLLGFERNFRSSSFISSAMLQLFRELK